MSFFKEFHSEIKLLVIVSIGAIVVSVGAILILKSLSSSTQVQQESQKVSVDAQPTEEPTEVDTSDWQTYTNEEFGFEFQYPSDGDLGYLSAEGAYLGSLSTAEARNTNTLIVGSRKGMHIIDIFADVNNVSIRSEPMEVVLNGVSYEKYEVVGVGYSTVYVTTYNAKQYWIELQKSELANQILSTFRFIEKKAKSANGDEAGSYVNVVVELRINGDSYPPSQLVGIKNDGSRVILLDDIDGALPISSYGTKVGYTKDQDNQYLVPYLYSFARNLQKVYIGRFVDGTEIYDNLHEYDLLLKKVQRTVAPPYYYIGSYNHQKRISPDGTKVAAFGSKNISLFDLIQESENILVEAKQEEIFDIASVEPELKWLDDTTLQYPVHFNDAPDEIRQVSIPKLGI